MQPNDSTRKFELNEIERQALGLPQGTLEWPMDNPVGLLELAQSKHILISGMDLSEYPAGVIRNSQQEKQWKYSGHLNTLIGQVVEYLPSTAEGAEAFLEQES